VATVRWTADQMARRLLPSGATPEFRDASGTLVLAEVQVHPAWVGRRMAALEARPASAWPSSPASARGWCPTGHRLPGGRPRARGAARRRTPRTRRPRWPAPGEETH
jgi:hypothetical protein